MSRGKKELKEVPYYPFDLDMVWPKVELGLVSGSMCEGLKTLYLGMAKD